MKILIKNGNVITPDKILENHYVLISDGKITEIDCMANLPNENFDKIYDAGGNYISPGFIDIHTHGAGGSDFMDETIEAIQNAAMTHMKYGTTTIYPTTLASTTTNLTNTFKNFKLAKEQITDGPNMPGLHLEGPYFALEHKGAQDPKYIKDPKESEYKKIVDLADGLIKRWSFAPERKGSLEFIKYLNSQNIISSIAHTNATFDEVAQAHEAGVNLITHFYSCMSTVRRINAYRVGGVIEAGYYFDDMYVEVIADGKHLPAEILKLIYKIKGTDRICLVTDSMRAAGQDVKTTVLGNLQTGMEVIVDDGVAKLKDKSAFAGSVATADRLVRTMIQLADVPLLDAVNMITRTPATIMNIYKTKGSIEIGKDADIVIFDDNINIKNVFINGKPHKG
jgi:N-acetylglucosamine-6-phosphate deacetylase